MAYGGRVSLPADEQRPPPRSRAPATQRLPRRSWPRSRSDRPRRGFPASPIETSPGSKSFPLTLSIVSQPRWVKPDEPHLAFVASLSTSASPSPPASTRAKVEGELQAERSSARALFGWPEQRDVAKATASLPLPALCRRTHSSMTRGSGASGGRGGREVHCRRRLQIRPPQGRPDHARRQKLLRAPSTV